MYNAMQSTAKNGTSNYCTSKLRDTLPAVECCNLLELKCTMLCKAVLKMEQVTTALASLETQEVPVTCVHGQLIFSTDVPCLLPATYYSTTCKWLCISA